MSGVRVNYTNGMSSPEFSFEPELNDDETITFNKRDSIRSVSAYVRDEEDTTVFGIEFYDIDDKILHAQNYELNENANSSNSET